MRLPRVHRDRGGIVADLFQLAGFGMVAAGLGMYSIPLALIAAGVTLFVVGGLATRR